MTTVQELTQPMVQLNQALTQMQQRNADVSRRLAGREPEVDELRQSVRESDSIVHTSAPEACTRDRTEWCNRSLKFLSCVGADVVWHRIGNAEQSQHIINVFANEARAANAVVHLTIAR